MKRYRSFSDGERIASLHGDWVRYEEVEEIAERLEKLKLFLREDPKYVYEQLTAIIKEIRGEK